MTESRRALASSGSCDESVPKATETADPSAGDRGGETGAVGVDSDATERDPVSAGAATSGGAATDRATGCGADDTVAAGGGWTTGIGCDERAGTIAVGIGELRGTGDDISDVATSGGGAGTGVTGGDGILMTEPAGLTMSLVTASVGDGGIG
jgi:hypothetical protein